MNDRIYVSWDDALAAVKLNEVWHFFIDMEIMFLLDYSSYDSRYDPSPGEFRYGTLIVDESNVETWMQSLSRELNLEQLSSTYWANTESRVTPTFVIDFDKKMWVGGNWKRDQSPLDEYQPDGWETHEDDVMKYLPVEIRRYFE